MPIPLTKTALLGGAITGEPAAESILAFMESDSMIAWMTSITAAILLAGLMAKMRDT